MPIDPDTLVAYAQLIIDTSKGYVGHPQVLQKKKGGKWGALPKLQRALPKPQAH
jgi:hypothetical protein